VITGSSALLAEAAHSTPTRPTRFCWASRCVAPGARPMRDIRSATVAPASFGRSSRRSFVRGRRVGFDWACRRPARECYAGRPVSRWMDRARGRLRLGRDGAAREPRGDEARSGALGQSTVTFLRQTSDPTLRALVVEDTAAPKCTRARARGVNNSRCQWTISTARFAKSSPRLPRSSST
jgi:hypothetical protein